MIEYPMKSAHSIKMGISSIEKIPVSGCKELDFLKDYFPEEYFDNYVIPKENQRKLLIQLENITNSLYGGIPVLCAGPKCEMKHICPFDKQGIAPVGYQCPLERIFLEKTIREYIDSESLNMSNKDEMEKARELAECDLYIKFRTPAVLAKNPTAFQEIARRYHPETGQLIEEKTEVSKAMEVRMKMTKRRDQILEELVSTRKGKLKHKLIKPGEDYATAAARLLKKLTSVKIKDTEFEIVGENEDDSRNSEGNSSGKIAPDDSDDS